MKIFDSTISTQLAKKLIKIGAIKISTQTPFTWSSGLKSPVYTDLRTTISYPEIRSYIKYSLARAIFSNFPESEVICSVATGALPHGALVSDVLNLPNIYIRSQKKSYGLQNQIEGVFLPGQKCIVIEDLISTGKSSLSVVEVLKQSGLDVLSVVSIFSYSLPIAEENFKNSGVDVITLCDYKTLQTLNPDLQDLASLI